jgi:flagellar motor switch protein FliN/FliY
MTDVALEADPAPETSNAFGEAAAPEPAVAASPSATLASGAGLAPMLQDVELKVEVVLGHARLRLSDLLEIRPGQAIELDRTRHSPVDVLVNGTLFARGEIVVIDDTNLGVRVVEIVGGDQTREARG